MPTHKFVKLALATAMLSPVILASGCIVSQAADAPRPYRVPPPPPPPLFYNWTGLYVGVHVGGGWSDLGGNLAGFGGNNGSGFIGGGQVGYNYQIGQWVWGLEVDVSGSGIKNTFGIPGLMTANINWDVLTTVTPRFGYAFDNWLVYGKAGGAWADISVSASSPFIVGGTMSAGGGTGSGWVVGIGAEYAFRNNWSAKVEYNHFDFGNDSAFATGNGVTLDTVKAGINYKFGGPGGPYWPF
jgi:outer membrane immunogenic protein